jgi:hypothetical protein
MPKKVSKLALSEQPIQWIRAIFSGVISAAFMMGFIDVFNMMGITPFSYEVYLGSLIFGYPYAAHNWTIGFLLNLFCGGIFGLIYSYCFEYVFFRSSARLGLKVGVWHLVTAAIAFFPFFCSIHEFMNTGLYPHFGVLGSALGAPTFILIVTGHFLFGSSMGTFYGPVREERVRSRYFEPGEVGEPDEWDVVSSKEDTEDRLPIYSSF